MPFFSYFVYNSKLSVDENNLLWNEPLPSNRHNVIFKEPNEISEGVSYGCYFKAVALLLERNNFEFLLRIIKNRIGLFVFPHQIDHVYIFLKKHGAFYHPAKIEVNIAGQTLAFVVNVAISDEGKNCIKKEIVAINLLNRDFPFGFLPKVYGCCIDEFFFGKQLSMFVGEWLTGFHEFHLSLNLKTENNEIVVWDSHLGNLILSEIETMEVYCQISMILSSYYDLFSTRHIFPWHNACGDFVIMTSKNRIQLRMVTARDFSPMLRNTHNCYESISEDEILYALIIFLLNVSIRVRLDRLDGVGDLVLSDEIYIYSIIKGFFRGLDLAVKNANLPHNFSSFFKIYVLNYGEENLKSLAYESINKTYKMRRNELSIISKNLDKHIKHLYRTLKVIDIRD